MITKLLNTAITILGAINPVKAVNSFLNDKPAKDLKAETERKRAENDRKLKERLK